MQVMTTAQVAQEAAGGAPLTDPARLVEIFGVFLAGAGGREVLAQIANRRKNKADATEVLTQAMTAVVKSAQELLEPQEKQLAALRIQQAEDLREIRAQHSAAMERVTTQLGEVREQYAAMKRENEDLRSRLAIAGQ